MTVLVMSSPLCSPQCDFNSLYKHSRFWMQLPDFSMEIIWYLLFILYMYSLVLIIFPWPPLLSLHAHFLYDFNKCVTITWNQYVFYVISLPCFVFLFVLCLAHTCCHCWHRIISNKFTIISSETVTFPVLTSRSGLQAWRWKWCSLCTI